MGAPGAPAYGRPGYPLAVWLGFDALKGLLRPPAWLVAAGLFVAPLSFFVYVTQEPTLSVLKAFTRTPLQTYVQRSDGGSQALAIVLYLLAPTIAIAGVDRCGAPAQAARAARLRGNDRRPRAQATRGRVAARRR